MYKKHTYKSKETSPKKGNAVACKPGSAKDRKAHLYTLPFMQENLQTGCKAIEDRQQKQASRQQNPIGNRIGN